MISLQTTQEAETNFYSSSDDASWIDTALPALSLAVLSAAGLRIRRVDTLVLPRLQAERC